MTEVRTAPKPFTYATVPLRRENLRQPAMLDLWNVGKEKSYPLPLVVPGEEARVIDADYDWQRYNGRRGIVTNYSHFSGLHTLQFTPYHEGYFQAREIVKGRR